MVHKLREWVSENIIQDAVMKISMNGKGDFESDWVAIDVASDHELKKTMLTGIHLAQKSPDF